MANKKLNKVNEKGMLTLVLIFLAIFALGILFVANPRMTGQVVVGVGEICNDTNFIDNDGCFEGVVEMGWECDDDVVPNVCTTICGDNLILGDEECDDGDIEDNDGCSDSCVVETDWICEGEPSICIEIVEPSCSNNLTLCNETNCVDIGGGYWYNELCNVEVEPSCSNNLTLCNETECAGVGYWYDNICNIEECIIDTCGSSCGDISDGCGGTLNCGACSTDESDTSSDESTDQEISSVTGDTIKSSCVSKWECTIWGECVEGMQTRTCTDIHNCVLKTEEEPSLSQECEAIIEETEVIVEEETCFDEIKNQDEEGIDCGGVCEKKCSVFTMVGSVVSGPIESGKEFFQKNKIIVLIISGILVLALAGFLTFGVLKEKKILPKIKMLFKKNLEKSREAPKETS